MQGIGKRDSRDEGGDSPINIRPSGQMLLDVLDIGHVDSFVEAALGVSSLG